MNVRKYFSWPNAVSAFFALIGALALIPYEQGQFATIFPPKVKPLLPPICATSAFLLRLRKPKDTPAAPAPPQMVINVHNHYYAREE